MNGATVTISSEFVGKSSARLSTKTAWATYARRRWPANGVKLAMYEWGLTEGEAKGLFATQISQPTIDKIIDHPRGGFGLGLVILEIRTQTALKSWVHNEKQRLAHEAARHAEESAALALLARDLPARLGVGAPGSGGVRGRLDSDRSEVRSIARPQSDRRAD